MREGKIETFEADGWGTVRTGDEAFAFHSTAIADGSRSIAVGATVNFVLVAGRQGRWEASAVRPCGPLQAD